MQKSKNKIFTFIYLLCLYIGIELLPVYSWIKDILFVIVFIMSIFEYKRNKTATEEIKHKSIYIIMVSILFLGCFSNMFYGLFYIKTLTVNFSSFTIDLISLIVKVLLEEMIFRYILNEGLDDIVKDNKIKILISSAIFALIHLINLFGNNYLLVIYQVGYTFVLGIVLNYLYYYFDKRFIVFIAHFSFNFFQQLLFSSLYKIEVDLLYSVYSLVYAIVILLYFIIVIVLERKERK